MHNKTAVLTIDFYDVYEVYNLLKKNNIDVGTPRFSDGSTNYTIIESKINTQNITFDTSISNELFLENCNKVFTYYHEKGPITNIKNCVWYTKVSKEQVKKIVKKYNLNV